MTGLDTNILLRYFLQDDPVQSAVASRFVESLRGDSPGFVSLVCLVELVWVMSRGNRASRAKILEILNGLVSSKELVIEQRETVQKALRMFRSGNADFADCLIERVAASAGCEQTITFDQTAAKACGMTLLT